MIFLRYESFGQYVRMYKVTSIILLINTVLYLVSLINPAALYHLLLIHAYPYHLELWRYVTSIFLHGGFDHFLFNSFAIFVFAPPLEFLLGRLRYVWLYLGSGVLGNLISMIVFNNTGIHSLGASGAIYGLYGAYIYLIAFRREALDASSRKTILVFLFIGFIYSFISQGINWAAHLGGFLGGMLIFWRIVVNVRR